jgi:PKD repeat protein
MAEIPRIPKIKQMKKKRVAVLLLLIAIVIGIAAAFFLHLLPGPAALMHLFEQKTGATPLISLASGTAPLDVTMNKPLIADFSSAAESLSSPLTLQFFDQSRGNPEQWVWDFGDSATSTLQHPVHQYARIGTYNVSLTVTRSDGSKKTISRNNILSVDQPASKSILLDTLRQGRIGKGSEVTFISADANSSVTINGKPYLLPEGSIVKMRTDSDADGKMIIRMDRLYSFEFPDVTLFVNGTQVAQGSSGECNLPSYRYFQANLTFSIGPTSGEIRQLVVDGTPLRSGVENSRILITYHSGTIGTDPTIITYPAYYEGAATSFSISDAVVAGFEPGTGITGPAPLSISLRDSSAGSPDRWHWDFGDRTQSDEQNPVHVYSVPGSYTVTLSVSRGDQKDSIVRKNAIIVSPPRVIANFSAFPLKGPAPLKVRFTDTSINAPSSWYWSFGPSSIPSNSSEQNPVVSYTSPGTYMVSLTAGNVYGSSDFTRPEYIIVTDPFKNPDKPFLVRTGKRGHVEKDSVVEFVVSNRPSSISINGVYHEITHGSLVQLIAMSDQQGEIYMVNGEIIKFSFPYIALYVNGDLVAAGKVDSIYVPSYSDFKTGLSYYLEPNSAFTYFAIAGYDVLSDLDNAWIRISNIGMNGGNLRLISSSNSTYIEGAMNQTVHDWIIE